MENKVPLCIKLNKENVDKIYKILNYYHTYKEFNGKNQWDNITLEEFIQGAVIREIEIIETYNHINSKGKKLTDRQYPLKNRLKEIMAQRNIKQLDLAEMTGIDRTNINLIVNNRNQPSTEHLLRIHAALGFIPLHEMFYREKQ